MNAQQQKIKDIEEWLETFCQGESISAIARRIGVPQRTLANHVKSGELAPEEIIAIARAYGFSPVFALEARGILTSEEVLSASSTIAASDIPIRELLRSVTNRLDDYTAAVEQSGKSGEFDAEPVQMKTALSDFVSQYNRGTVFVHNQKPMFEVIHNEIEIEQIHELHKAALNPGYRPEDEPDGMV